MRSLSLRVWLLIISSAVLQALPFAIAGPVPSWRRAFCWIALAPLLAAFLTKRRGRRPLPPGRTALIGYCCGVLWYLFNCYWIYQTMNKYGGLAKPVALLVLLLFALYLGLYHALFGWIIGWMRRGLGRQYALLASPFVWVAVELARARITGFPWDLLGYAQVDNLMLTRIAPYGGVMMISFVVAGVSALFAAAYLHSNQKYKIIFGVAAFVLAAGLQAGSEYPVLRDKSQKVATLLQENLAVGREADEDEALQATDKYRIFAEESSNPKAPVSDGGTDIRWLPLPGAIVQDFVIWPEAPADFVTSNQMFQLQLGNVARANNATVVAGSIGVEESHDTGTGAREFGSAAVFDNNGTLVGRYDKVHRVPWGEYVPYEKLFFFAGKLVANVSHLEAGTERKVFHINDKNFGVLICYESIFGDEVREFVNGGAEVLINISDDGWYGDTGAPWQHLDMARMRAIENRRWILRDTNTGITTSIDPHGRGIFTTPRHVRGAFAFPFAYNTGKTFYTRHGDVFAWLCFIATVLLLAYAIARRGLPKTTSTQEVN